MKGLIIKDPWIDYILDGLKPWEIRGSNTKFRGRIELIKSGTGMIYGNVNLVDTLKLQYREIEENKDKHLIQDRYDISYLHPWAWVLENPKIYAEPIPYKHPQGAVIWVNL